MKYCLPTKNSRCLLCDKEIKKYTIYSLLFEEDKLCTECRKKMKIKHQRFSIEGLKVETFYDYNSFFKDCLLQYKECYDEALKDIFLYKIDDYLRIRYFGYRIIYVPSSKRKKEERGFNHLKEMFKNLGFKEAKGIEMKEEITQINKGYEERRKMLNNYIYTGKKYPKLLIVDDVFTSGSSVLGVYNALRGIGTRVRCVVISKT